MTGVDEQLVAQAAALVNAIGDQAARDEANYRRGYEAAAELFFGHGVEVGRAQAETSMARAWSAIARHVRGMASVPTIAERVRRRTTPSGPAYLASVARHGGTEFGGVRRPRVPVPLAVAETADARAQVVA